MADKKKRKASKKKDEKIEVVLFKSDTCAFCPRAEEVVRETIEDFGADVFRLVEDAGVLDRHGPAVEVDHAGLGGDVGLVERRLAHRGSIDWRGGIACADPTAAAGRDKAAAGSRPLSGGSRRRRVYSRSTKYYSVRHRGDVRRCEGREWNNKRRGESRDCTLG